MKYHVWIYYNYLSSNLYIVVHAVQNKNMVLPFIFPFILPFPNCIEFWVLTPFDHSVFNLWIRNDMTCLDNLISI
jgi:hypothetical protein